MLEPQDAPLRNNEEQPMEALPAVYDDKIETLSQQTSRENLLIAVRCKAMAKEETTRLEAQIERSKTAVTPNLSFNYQHFSRLMTDGWIDDEIINCYTTILKLREEELRQKYSEKRRCIFFNSHFMDKYEEKGFTGVVSWSKLFNEDLIDNKVDKVFVPINYKAFH